MLLVNATVDQCNGSCLFGAFDGCKKNINIFQCLTRRPQSRAVKGEMIRFLF